MAILWSKTIDNVIYEVRSAGNTQRLYRDGVLHSAYNPNKLISGSIWDLLFLPTLFYKPNEIKRVLVLGVGGGAVIHLLNRFIQPQSIVGVEIDKMHIDLAKDFFELQYKNLQLIHADAITWVNQYQSEPFDLIIEDVFTEEAGEPLRLMHEDESWLVQLRKKLSLTGMLVINHGTEKEVRFTKQHAGKYTACFQFTTPLLQNKVLALLKQASSTTILNRRIDDSEELSKFKTQQQLSYFCRKLY